MVDLQHDRVVTQEQDDWAPYMTRKQEKKAAMEHDAPLESEYLKAVFKEGVVYSLPVADAEVLQVRSAAEVTKLISPAIMLMAWSRGRTCKARRRRRASRNSKLDTLRPAGSKPASSISSTCAESPVGK